MADLEIAEIYYESGAVKYRYSRYLASDGSRWIRHGLFVAYGENGTVVSEGNYDHGVEHGPWKDFHPNGSIAASGNYDQGNEVGTWTYWNADGQPET
jgi:antitoxin component YwqK of YwqJK toxin-antitoxin module